MLDYAVDYSLTDWHKMMAARCLPIWVTTQNFTTVNCHMMKVQNVNFQY